MDSNKQGKKVFIIMFFVMGTFFLIPVVIITAIDGFSTYMLIPIIMLAIMGGFFLLIFSLANNNAKRQIRFNSDSYTTTERHCIQCHEQISTTDKYCPECGTEQTEYIVCDYCGHQNNKHLLQCQNCNALIK